MQIDKQMGVFREIADICCEAMKELKRANKRLEALIDRQEGQNADR